MILYTSLYEVTCQLLFVIVIYPHHDTINELLTGEIFSCESANHVQYTVQTIRVQVSKLTKKINLTITQQYMDKLHAFQTSFINFGMTCITYKVKLNTCELLFFLT